MAYQDTWRDGALLEWGERSCADRYTAIREVLAALAEPFSMLDLGAATGYFATRAAEDFDAQVTAVDPLPALREAAGERLMVVSRRLSPADLRAMPRHDVTLALSVLHHFADWRQALAQVRAARRWAIIEVPHPGERWMRTAAARGQLAELHDAVAAASVRKLGEFERVGRDGSRHQRPMYLVPGTVDALTGRVFSGSGTCSRRLPQFGRGLDARLGYTPHPGSLNLRLDAPPDLGPPHVDWRGRSGRRTRDYQFWPAWVGDLACHAMDPGGRNHGPSTIEIVAPVRLRDQLGLGDGDTLTVDVEVTRGR